MREEGIKRTAIFLAVVVCAAVVIFVAVIGVNLADALEGFELSPPTSATP